MEKIKIGFIGLGQRGHWLIRDTFPDLLKTDVEIVAVCDLYEDRIERAADCVEKNTGKRPIGTTDYHDILKMDEVQAVIISAAWEVHVEMAIAAMKAGKYVGLEVGGAYSVDQCFELVKTHEETGVHCMFLENCCYGKLELLALNMARQGVFGDIVHCTGGYTHDLRQEVSDGEEIRHYRLLNYLNRNCDNYPTHQIGPIAKILDINNGNRFVSLVSMASPAKGLNAYVADRKGADHKLAKAEFKQGDVVTSIIKCANGETITITLETTLPATYTRDFSLRGTKGGLYENTNSIFIDKEHNKHEWNPKLLWDNIKEYEEQYTHPIWKNYEAKGGHGGVDWLVLNAFVEAVRNNERPPIDVYDAAAYMAITPLTEESIALGSMPVVFPDFTSGKWYKKRDIVENKYTLDKIKD